MCRCTLTLFVFGGLIFPAVGLRGAADENGIAPAGAKLELLYTRTADIKKGLTEGPAVAPDGSIYFSDIPLGKDHGLIVRFDPKTKKTSVFAEDSHKSNGLNFNSKGELIACEGCDGGGRCVSRWNTKTGRREVIVDRYQGKQFNSPNDLTIDHQDRIYFSDPRYVGTEPRELEHHAVYRVDPDGKVVEVTHEVEKPNGVALSPDDKTLYVADHNNGSDNIESDAPAKPGAMKIYAFPLGSDGLVAGPRKTIYDFGDDKGVDGMCVDSQGNLVMAARTLKRPGILVITPEGKEVGFVPTGPANQKADKGSEPTGLPSNCEFGIGDDANTLYVTVDKSLYRVKLNDQGFHVPFKTR